MKNELYEALERKAREEGVSKSRLVVRYIEEKLALDKDDDMWYNPGWYNTGS